MYYYMLFLLYIGAVALGIPDSLLAAAWPAIHDDLNLPVSGASIIYAITTACTVFSCFMADRVERVISKGWMIAGSVFLTAAAVFGNSLAAGFLMLCLIAIPYGLGAGGIDASLNDYMAKHYSSRHMNFMHALWGVGTIIGPNVFRQVLSHGVTWKMGYSYSSYILFWNFDSAFIQYQAME